MVAVDVDALQARLSEYLRHVQEGETVLVTANGVVIATLSPPRSPESLATGAPAATQIASGEVRPARLPKGDWTWKVQGAGLPAGTVHDILDELRKDSWED